MKAWMIAAAALLALGLAPAADAADFWRRIDNPAPVTGLDGKTHAATCSAYPGTDPTYRFWTRKGKTDKLVVYFEGGGACWDDLTCTFPAAPRLPDAVPQFYTNAIRATSAPRDITGLFDNTRADNPVKDWTVVYIPYCTGDIHLGSATRTYNNYGHPVYPLPSQFEIRHRGFDNFMVVLDWIQRNVKAPQQVLVTGASAGGYGASANHPWVAKLFPNAQLSVLADASQGVTTPAWAAGTPGFGSWNAQLAPWVFAAGSKPADFLRQGARAYPNGRFAQYTTNLDAVQIGFYQLMTQFYGPGGSCADPTADWSLQAMTTLASYRDELANFRSYVAPGTSHTILRSTAYYDPVNWGPSFAGWLGTMLADPAAWTSAACPDCVAPVPCP